MTSYIYIQNTRTRRNDHYRSRVVGFVVYSGGEVVVDRILADCQYWTELNDVLDSFYVQHVVPESLSVTFSQKSILLFLVMTIEQS